MQITSQIVQPLQFLNPDTYINKGAADEAMLGTPARQNFLAQVLKILAGSNMVDVKILKTREIIQLQASVPLKPGQLILISANEDGIELQTNPKKAAEHLFRLLLPKQGSIRDALAAILRSTRDTTTPQPSGKPQQLPGKEIDPDLLTKKMLRALPSRQDIVKPELLKQFIRNAGILALPERAETRNPPAVTLPPGQQAQSLSRSPLGQLVLPLLKNLLQLSGLPASDPSSASREQVPRVAEALARIMLNQMKPVNLVEVNEIDIRRTELVARNDNQLDGFQIEITPPKPHAEKDKDENGSGLAGQGSHSKKWTVRLSFDFPELGKITAFIILEPEKYVELNFWSERPRTFELITSLRKKLQQKLQKKLQAQGIGQLKIDVFEGEIPDQQSVVTSQLINEIA